MKLLPKQIEAVKESVQDFLVEVTAAETVPEELKTQVADLEQNLDALDDVSNLASLAGGMDLSALLGGGSLNRLVGPVAYNRLIAPPTAAEYSGSAANPTPDSTPYSNPLTLFTFIIDFLFFPSCIPIFKAQSGL